MSDFPKFFWENLANPRPPFFMSVCARLGVYTMLNTATLKEEGSLVKVYNFVGSSHACPPTLPHLGMHQIIRAMILHNNDI